MATFVVCTRCGKVCETAGPDQIPKSWKTSDTRLLCPRCADEEASGSDIIDEEIIYPSPTADTLDEAFDDEACEVCGAPCQGH